MRDDTDGILRLHGSAGVRGALHRTVDRVAMWTEDRIPRPACGYRHGPAGPLRCFDSLPEVPCAPPASGRWTFRSPAGGEPVSVRIVPGVRERRASTPSPSSDRAARGTVLLVPPWKIRDVRAVAGWSRRLARSARDVWLYVPPHHLERAGAGRSGEAFVSPDLQALRSTVEQAVLELRVLVAAAARRGPVALVGLSLGAFVGALAATAPEPFDAAVLVAPPDLVVSLTRTRIGARYRELAERAGAPIPDTSTLEAALVTFSAALRIPTARRIFIAAGTHDAIVPPQGPVALARAWGVEPRLYRRGHITLLLACARVRRDVVTFLDGR